MGLDGYSGLVAQGYDDLGRRTSLTRGSGLAISYSYDNLSRLTSLAVDAASTDRDVTWAFTGRNAANQITSWNATSTVYDYVQATATPDNRSYNGLNQDASVAGLTTNCSDAGAGYDCSGNMTKDYDSSRTFIYDVHNRLISSVGDGHDVKLNYDPEGRLHRTIDSSGITLFSYDGVNLIGEYGATDCSSVTDYDQAGCSILTQRQFVHGTGTDEPLVWFQGSGYGDTRYFVQNYQGSVIGYTDAGGITQQIYKYGPWGEPKGENNTESWSGSRFRYTGQTVLAGAGLYYYKARVYDPGMGRFLQTDPIGSEDDLNLYGYVGEDPVNGTDPTGMQAAATQTETRTYTCSPAMCGLIQDYYTAQNAVVGVWNAGVDATNNSNSKGQTRTSTTVLPDEVANKQKYAYNIDTSTLIHILDYPAGNSFHDKAVAALGFRNALISPVAMQEYLNGGGPVTKEMAASRFAAFMATGQGQLIPGVPTVDPGIRTTSSQTVNDGLIVSAGMAAGVKTLTGDKNSMAKIAPPGTIVTY